MAYTHNDEEMKLFIRRYLQKVFSLIFYLTGSDSDKAYEVTASTFAGTFRKVPSLQDEDAFLITLIQTAIDKSRTAKIMPSSKEPPFKDVPPERKKILLILKDVLQTLPFEEKTLLLLRDQLHFSYQNISSILKTSQGNVRSQVNQARIQIRKNVEKALL